MADAQYLKHKLLLQHVIHGPTEQLSYGENCDLNDTVFNTLSGRIQLGECVFFGHGCMVLTGSHDYTTTGLERKTHPSQGRDIIIGSGVWIGSGAIILGPSIIADNAVIAAGAIVKSDCPEASIYGGIPARKISDIQFRDHETDFKADT